MPCLSPYAANPYARPYSPDRLPSIDELLRIFPSEEICLEFLFGLEGGNDRPCSRCGRSRWSRRSAKIYVCSVCGTSYCPTAGTVFQGTHLDLRLWMIALLLFCQSSRLLSARFLADFLGISSLAALLMRDKIWRRLGEIAKPGILGGEGVAIEVDETLISRHVRRRSTTGRLSAFGITDRRTFRVFVVNNRRRATLLPILRRHVACGSIVNTDGFASYARLEAEGYAHLVCNHSSGFFVGFDGAKTTSIDSYWGELKKTLSGVHHGISEARLALFLNAHACRYSYRDAPERLFWELVGGKPSVLIENVAPPEPVLLSQGSNMPRCATASYRELHSLFANESEAAALLGRLAREKFSSCGACGTDGKLYFASAERRIICKACGSKRSIRHGTLFSGSKIPLRTWFALVWLVTLNSRGTSLSFASAHLNVSRAAAGGMLTRLRQAMAHSLRRRVIGGDGQTVDLKLSSLRVRPPVGHPRCRRRTIVIASSDGEWICDVLPKASARYVHLWIKRRVSPGSIVRHPTGKAFAEVCEARVRSEPFSFENTRSLSCGGSLLAIKAALATFHTGIDYHKAALFLKEREFKARCKGMNFPQILDCLIFSVPQDK